MRGNKRITAVVLFCVALVLWIGTISHNTLGFVAVSNPETFGFDTWTALMWLLFLYAIRHLYRTFRKKEHI
jgi:hypothetical protein